MSHPASPTPIRLVHYAAHDPTAIAEALNAQPHLRVVDTATTEARVTVCLGGDAEHVARLAPAAPVIALVEAPDVNTTVDLMRAGAVGVAALDDTARLVALINQELAPAGDSVLTGPHHLAASHRELTAFRHHLDSILNTMQDALMSMSLPDRKVIVVSSQFEAVYGHPVEAFMNDPNFFRQVVHPDDLEAVLTAQAQCLREGYTEHDHRIIRPDGQVRWIRRRAWVNYDEAGRPVRINDSGRDITEQKAAQDQLARSEELYRVTLSNISDAVFITDDLGQLTFVCPNVNILFGQTQAEVEALGTIAALLGEGLFDMGDLLRAGEIRNIERTITTKHGETIDLWISVKHVDIFGGSVLYACRDVTDQKRATDALRASEARLAALVSSQTNYVVRTNLEGYHVYANHNFEKEYGYLYADVGWMGGYALDSICTYHHQRTRETVERCIAQPGTVFQVELDKPRYDGAIRTTLWDFVCLTNGDGVPVELQCMGIDISERVQAERALRQSEQRYREMFERVDLPKLLIDPENGAILDANPAAVAYYGYPLPALRGMTLHEINQAPRARTDATIAAILGGTTTPYGVVQQRADGAIRDVEVYSGIIHVNDKPALYSVMIDVTARNQAEREIEAINATLEQRVQQRTKELEQAKEHIAEERNLLRTVIDAVPDFIYVKDLHHRMVLNNVAHARSVGYDNPLDIVGKTDAELFPAPLAEKFTADEKRLLTTGQALVNAEERSLGGDGAPTWVQTTKVPLRNVQGDLIGLVGITHDVSEIKAKEEALLHSQQRLRESEHMLQLVLDTIPVRVFWKTRDSVYMGCNHLFAQDAGLAHTQDIIGKRDQDLPWLAEQAAAYLADDRAVVESGVPKLDFEETQRTSNGDLVTLRTNKIPLKTLDGNVIGILGTYIDITAQKAALEQLHYLANLQAQMQDAVIGIDLDFNIKSWNAAAEHMYGWRADEALGQRLDIIVETQFLSNETVESSMQTLLSAGHWQGEVVQFHRDGTPINVIASIVINRDNDGQPIGMIGVNHNITERKQAEDALRESEERFRLLAENVTDMISRHTPDGLYTYATPSATLVTGFSPDELVGRPAYTFFHPDDIPDIQQSHETILATPLVYTISYRIKQKHGAYRWVETTSHTIRDAQGYIIEIIAVTRDISERKQAEQELRESEERFRVMAESVSDVITRLTPEGIPTYQSPSVKSVLGYAPDELLGRPIRELIHPDDLDNLEAVARDARTKTGTHTAVFRHRHKDGRYPWLETKFQFLYDDNTHEPTQMIATSRDITERVAFEEQLQTLSRRLQLATQAGGIGIWDWNIVDDSLYWDNHMYEIYDVPRDDTEDNLTRWIRHVHPEDLPTVQAAVAEAIAKNEPFNEEFRVVLHDGRVRVLRASAVVVPSMDHTPERMVGVNIDITAVKEAQQTLQNALLRERELSELKSQFVSMTSHQFRTPLAAILANTETLTQYRSRMSDEQIETRLDRIRKQVLQMKGLMEDVLALSRIQANRMPYEPTAGDMDALCREVIESFEQQPAYQGRITYTASQSPLRHTFDPRLMHHVVNNLVHNALKYSPGGTPVSVTLTRTGGHVTLTVTDQGIGIPPEYRPNLFQPFRRARNVGAIAGTGLGLSIAKQAVDAHGGTIEVDSTPAVGTTFTITLPGDEPLETRNHDEDSGH